MSNYHALRRGATRASAAQFSPINTEAEAFDPERFPILAEHWPDLAVPQLMDDVRDQHLISRLHALGPRPTAELLRELATEHGIGAEIRIKLERYGELSPETVRALGADRFASHMFAVGS